MKSILFFGLLAVYIVAGFHCPPNITQHLLEGDVINNTFRFDVAIQNPSPYFIREVLLVPSTNMTVEGMNVTESGIEFLDWLRWLPPHKTYHWTYTQDSAVPATFEVVVSECVNRTKYHGNPCNNTRPTAEPTRKPTEEPTGRPSRPTSAPTSAPTSTPTSAPISEPTTEPSQPSSAPTSAPTSDPTSEPTSAPTSEPTPGPTSAPTSKPTSDPTAEPTSASTSAPSSAPSSAPTLAPTSAPTVAPTLAPTSAPSAPTSAPSNSTISGKCSGSPRMLNGKPCASTTRYWDGTLGACGCGTSSGAFSWVADTYTAAASPPIFGTATNCGTGCGKCYKLTTTGSSPAGKGASAGQTITVMVTNLCPAGGEWCASGINSFEYGAHFDLADSPTGNLISKMGWDNPEVVYEEVSCSGLLTPTASDASTCTCPTA